LNKSAKIVFVVLFSAVAVGAVFYYASSLQGVTELPTTSLSAEPQPEKEQEPQSQTRPEPQPESVESQSPSKTSIVVPDDYPTIAAAIGNATDGATIHVRAGIYDGPENQTLVINKTISITGEGQLRTRISLHPALVEQQIFTSTFIVPSTAVIVESDNVQLSGFTIAAPGGITLNGENIKVTDNVIEGSGLRLSDTNSTVARNTLHGGLTLTGSSHSIEDNTIIAGVEFKGSFSTLARNTIGNDINLNGSHNVINGNTFPAMYMDDSHSNTISNNTFRMLWITLRGHGCNNNLVFRNLVKGPGLWGILMGHGFYNVFYENTITNFTGSHDGYGVAIGGNHYVAENNTFFRNIFVNNNKNVGWNWDQNGIGNSWDNGEAGNYWSDYSGADENGDGVGDTPYVINDRNIDNHPLMTPPIFS
jgi:nitrous oxidase accessory protein